MDVHRAIDSVVGEVSLILSRFKSHFEQTEPASRHSAELLEDIQKLITSLDDIAIYIASNEEVVPTESPPPTELDLDDPPATGGLRLPTVSMSYDTSDIEFPETPLDEDTEMRDGSSTEADSDSDVQPDTAPKQGQSSQTAVTPAQSVTPQPAADTAPVFSCTANELSSASPEIYDRICADNRAQEYGYAKLEVAGIPSFTPSRPERLGRGYSSYVQYAVEGAFSTIKDPERTPRTVRYPSYPYPTHEHDWTRSELEAAYENVVQTPPKNPVLYIIGPPTFPVPLELSCGERLRQRGKDTMPGIQTQYMHWSVSQCPTISAVRAEEAWLGSANVVLAGEYKLLLVIKPEDSERFESCMREHFAASGDKQCSHFISHMAVAVPPSQLRSWNISFDIASFGPNQGFATIVGRVYYGVVNLGTNLALAVNFEQSNSLEMPPGYTFCTRICGRSHVSKSDVTFRTILELEDMQRLLKRRGWKIPIFRKDHKPRVLELAAMISSEEAIRQFVDLVKYLRAEDNWLRHHPDVVRHIGFGIKKARANTLLGKFVCRSQQTQLARWMDESKRGRQRVDARVKRRIMSAMECSDSTFDFYLSQGRKWNRLYGDYDGLLCFVPLLKSDTFDIKPSHYIDMSDEELGQFHQLLDNDFTRSLCSAGRSLQQVIRTPTDVEFKWESTNVLPSLNDISRLGEFDTITQNMFDLSRYPDWPMPPGWPTGWKWPTDPTTEGNIGCEFCADAICNCIERIFPTISLRIKRYEGTGLGLQAVAAGQGQLAYQRGSLIGQITGTIAPLNTRVDGEWALEVVRPDINLEVCRLDCSERSNCFRLLNHDCEPCAAFVPKRVSGRVLMVVEAIRDIYDGMEITTSYGMGHFGDACLCQTCRVKGRSHPQPSIIT